MGATEVTATVRNPADPLKAWTGVLLADNGAVDCLIPRRHMESIGLTARGQQAYRLANGTRITLEYTVAELEVEGEVTGVRVILGANDSLGILGLTALESLGLVVDPCSQTLRRLPEVDILGVDRIARQVSSRGHGPGSVHLAALSIVRDPSDSTAARSTCLGRRAATTRHLGNEPPILTEPVAPSSTYSIACGLADTR